MIGTNLFDLALKAKLPLVSVRTNDTIHAMSVIEHIAGQEISVVTNPNETGLRRLKCEISVLVMDRPMAMDDLYALAIEQEKTFILINPEFDAEQDTVFDAGMLPVPRAMIKAMLKDVVGLFDIPEALVTLMGGLSLKEVRECCLLSIARDGSLTYEGVMATRSIYASRMRGLNQVDLDMPCYLPDAGVEKWMSMNAQPFLQPDDPQLIPRGVLLNGVPGVGKTSAAKQIARTLNIPLFRMDVSSMMEKWQGEAERFLRNALDQIDREEPCVLLIDEIEKVFKHEGDEGSGTSSRMLSQLLWWLQEHKTRVLTVMTTNDFSSLPPEVYRPGRIDRVIEVRPLIPKDAMLLAKAVYDSLEDVTKALVGPSMVIPKLREWVYDWPMKDDKRLFPHAAVTSKVIETVKASMQKSI